MPCDATVLIPTHDHGRLIRHAIESVLLQTVTDFELFVVGDGAPDETADIVEELRRGDGRIRYFPNAKGPRHGELHRHEALKEATGAIVCYLADDDLWLPNHLATLQKLLCVADFSAALGAFMMPDGSVRFLPLDLATEGYRQWLRLRGNLFPLSCGAHTLELYRRLPWGWRSAPADVATDLYMWRQILQEGCAANSATRPTCLHFAAVHRATWSKEQREAEIAGFAARLRDPSEIERLREGLHDAYVHGMARRALGAVREMIAL